MSRADPGPAPRLRDHPRAVNLGRLGCGGAVARPVAVLSDGSGFHREPGSSVLTGLLGSAALLREHAGVAVNTVLVTADSDRELIMELRGMAPEVDGVYLVHTEPARSRNAQVALASVVPVVTDVQTTAVAAAAAALTTLTRAGIAPGAGRVVIVGADYNPLVAALAMAAGIRDVDSFGLDEVPHTRLRTLARRASAVIDLTGAAGTAGQSTPAITVVDEPSTALLALPGLLAAARASARPVSLLDCLATTLAIADRTPADRLLPRLSDSGLADIAVSAVPAAVQHPRPVR